MPKSSPSSKTILPGNAKRFNWLPILLGLTVLGISGLFFTRSLLSPPKNFTECLEVKGSLTQESYPAICITPDGLTFTEETPLPEATDLPIIPKMGTTPEPSNSNPATNPLPSTTPGCLPAGCSGQLCVLATEADDTMTTCEYKPEYACVNFSTCELQSDGKCGWTDTDAYRQCKEQY